MHADEKDALGRLLTDNDWMAAELTRLQELINLLEDEIDRCHATIDLLRARLSDDGEGEVEAEFSPTSAA